MVYNKALFVGIPFLTHQHFHEVLRSFPSNWRVSNCFSWSISVGLNCTQLSQWLNPAFPVTVGYLQGKIKENLHDNGKKTQPVEDVYLLTSKNGDFPASQPAMLGRKAVVVPLPGSADFSSLCDSRPFSESPLLSAWGEAKRPGWGCWAHDGWAHWVGLFFFFGWGLRKGWKKPSIPTTQWYGIFTYI